MRARLDALLGALLAALLVGVGGSPPIVSGEREVRAAVGGRAEITCHVNHMPPGVQMSWVRRPGLQVLWSGSLRFSAGARVSARQALRAYTLSVDLLRPGDAGLYECQLNTDPKTSWTTRLIVLDEPDPELELWVESDGVRLKESETKEGKREVTLPAGGRGGELRCLGRGALRWELAGRPLQESSVAACPLEQGAQCEVVSLRVAGGRAGGRAAGRYWCRSGAQRADITVTVEDDPRTDESRWEDMMGDAAGAWRGAGAVTSLSSLAALLTLLLLSLVTSFL